MLLHSFFTDTRTVANKISHILIFNIDDLQVVVLAEIHPGSHVLEIMVKPWGLLHDVAAVVRML